MEEYIFRFVDIDGRKLDVKASNIHEARQKLLETLEWEFEEKIPIP